MPGCRGENTISAWWLYLKQPSIPAVLAITKDSFVVFTSNIFAILGLRAFYFAVAGFMQMFRFLTYGLSVLLVFIGGKMIASAIWGSHMPIGVSLGIIGGILVTSVVMSLAIPPKDPPRDDTTDEPRENI